MYVIVCGGGRMGTNLVKELATEKHDVVVIEKDPEVAKNLANDLNATVIEGNATDIKIMEEAGLEKADIVVALTPSESENLLICLTAKKKKACKTASRIERVESEDMFKKLGIDTIIFPERAAAHYLEELITKPEVLDLAFIDRGDAAILEFEVKKEGKVVGKKVKDLEYPKGSLIIAVYEDEKLMIPKPDFRMREGEKVLILTMNKAINKVRKIFG